MTGIRLATHEDVATLARFRVNLVLEDRPDDAIHAESLFAECVAWFEREVAATGSFRAWIATDGNAAIGTAGYRVSDLMPRLGGPPREARVHNVYVAPAYRNRGVGEALMREVMAEIALGRFHRVTLGPRERSRPFYERLGFEASPDMRLPPV